MESLRVLVYQLHLLDVWTLVMLEMIPGEIKMCRRYDYCPSYKLFIDINKILIGLHNQIFRLSYAY